MGRITTNVLSDGRIQFIVSIEVGDYTNWAVYVCSNVNHGEGMGGACDVDIPYYVERIDGTNNYTFYRNKCSGLYSAGKYQAVLALQHTGMVDYDTFDVICNGGVGLGSISIPSSLSILVNETSTLTAVCKDTNGNNMTCPQLTFSSNNANIAWIEATGPNTVKVTGAGAGTTTINASAGGKVSNYCNVTVTAPPPPPEKKYTCNTNYQCVESSTGMSLSDCQATCKPPTATKYNCVSGVCQGPFTSGTYNSSAECQAACTITQKWKCINPATNTCAQTSDGTFDTEAQCKAATSCQPSGVQTWYCNTSTKICSLQTGSGGHATKALCDIACSGGDGEEGDPCDMCSDKEICLFGSCYKKNTVYMAAGAVVLLMMLTKK